MHKMIMRANLKKEAQTSEKQNNKKMYSIRKDCEGKLICLNKVLDILKLEKDKVGNFIAQKKRLDAILKNAGTVFWFFLLSKLQY